MKSVWDGEQVESKDEMGGQVGCGLALRAAIPAQNWAPTSWWEAERKRPSIAMPSWAQSWCRAVCFTRGGVRWRVVGPESETFAGPLQRRVPAGRRERGFSLHSELQTSRPGLLGGGNPCDRRPVRERLSQTRAAHLKSTCRSGGGTPCDRV